MARAARLRVVVDAAPVTRTVISLVAPFAAADDADRERLAHLPQRLDEQREVALDQLDAAGAVREREHAVVGRAFAVDGDRVERVVDDRLQRALQQRRRRPAASVVTNPSIVAMFGSIMPEPLAMPPTRNVPAGGRDFDRRFLRKRIGRHDRARGVAAAVAGERCRRGSRCRAATLAMSSLTPMTPVDATSTADGSQPTRRGGERGHRLGVRHPVGCRCRRWRSRC